MGDDDDDDDIKVLYHRGGHDTEREAAEAIFPHVTALQAQVLTYYMGIWPKGATQQEATEALGLTTKSTVRTRVKELSDKKLVVDTGKRRQHPPSKRNCIIWRYRPYQLQLPLDDQ